MTASSTPASASADSPLDPRDELVLETDLVATTAPSSGHSKAHPHVHDPQAQRKLLNRLARIEGSVRGISSMIERQQPCPDVLLQIAAVRGALDRVARLILDEHISECIAHAANSDDIKVELDELRKAIDRFIG